MNPRDLESKMREALAKKPVLSPEREAALFTAAEELLAGRRARLAERETRATRATRARERRWERLRAIGQRLVSGLALEPQTPAAAAMVAALVLAFLALHPMRHGGGAIASRELPEFPKFNDAPARYDAQWLAEQEKYEREVEDAHEKNSGGI